MIRKIIFMLSVVCIQSMNGSALVSTKIEGLSIITVENQWQKIDIYKSALLRVDQTPEDKIKLTQMGMAWLITTKPVANK